MWQALAKFLAASSEQSKASHNQSHQNDPDDESLVATGPSSMLTRPTRDPDDPPNRKRKSSAAVDESGGRNSLQTAQDSSTTIKKRRLDDKKRPTASRTIHDAFRVLHHVTESQDTVMGLCAYFCLLPKIDSGSILDKYSADDFVRMHEAFHKSLQPKSLSYHAWFQQTCQPRRDQRDTAVQQSEDGVKNQESSTDKPIILTPLMLAELHRENPYIFRQVEAMMLLTLEN